MTRTIQLSSGALTVDVESHDVDLDSLCGFGARRSLKRGFVFVSKVLGKHVPVVPSQMQSIHRRLAAKLMGIERPAVFVGLAETATALGQGVYEKWIEQTGDSDSIFLHTTRHRLPFAPAFGFEESHSHATGHIVYQPLAPECRRVFEQARSLVLIDDEISTGQTLANLADSYRRANPKVAETHWACLTDWSGAERRSELSQRFHLHSLLRGRYQFSPNERFDPGPVPSAESSCASSLDLPNWTGRLGVRGRLDLNFAECLSGANLSAGDRILVLGTAEFSYAPYRLALHLEDRGFNVRYQSTTRSPLMAEGELGSVLEFEDNYCEGISHYVYNVADKRYDRIFVAYETKPLPPAHKLVEMIDAQPIFLV